MAEQKGLYVQTDSPQTNLRRDSAELFIKEIIPPLHLTLVSFRDCINIIKPKCVLLQSQEVLVWNGQITSIVCITMMELMVATSNGLVLRYRWDGSENRDYNLDLRRIPFCINQQVSKGIRFSYILKQLNQCCVLAIPIVEENTFIADMEYSPLVGGFAIALNDGRAAFLTSSTLKFDPNVNK